jgi:hypothetical protein
MSEWRDTVRPGYFGRRRDEKIAALHKLHGEGDWRLVWRLGGEDLDFATACKRAYEESYLRHLVKRPDVVDRICSYTECFDNAETNVESGLDYTKQEAFSTHIQDIAVRNVVVLLGRRFEGSVGCLLQIRGPDSDGWKLGLNPGAVSFFDRSLIIVPSLAPQWAGHGSVEDYWQSNKFLQARSAP